ncbi:MAG: hypothetical protein OHK93_001822 [Ramalina farinacea]|uniref:Uncharacterized protein n=1 Tax=Ramalina farinacea TaxID=258253 RepID=A0AA43QQ77_9LECA|nr:hypothetical protein [Ramalina farinacea]
MHQSTLVTSLLLALRAVQVAGQAAETTTNPLNNFINGAQGAAGAVNSAISAQSPSSSSSTPSSSSTTPTAAAASSSAPATHHHGLSNGAKIGIIVGCVVAAVFIIGLLAGICCCLMLRKRRRNKRNPTPVADEEIKTWKEKPTNPGRNYSPAAAAHGRQSTDHHPSVPLMAAGAIPHGSHSQAPSLSQHPAMRQPQENPFGDNAAINQSPRNSNHHGAAAGLAGATAAGAAGYGVHRHHQNQHANAATAPPIANTNSPFQSGVGTTGAATAGATGFGAHQPQSTQGNQLPVSNSPHMQNIRHGLPPGLAASDMGPASGSGLPQQSNAPIHNGIDTLPSSNRPTSNSHNGMKAAGGVAAAGAAAYGVHQHEEKKRLRNSSGSRSRSQSRSRSRPRSGGVLPTHNDADRPPTPFGLSGIGQPYEDMHVHVLQTEAPSHDLRRSLHQREAPVEPGYSDESDNRSSRNSGVLSNKPRIPSRSPNRYSTINTNSYDSSASNNTTSSNSVGEPYSSMNDPYRPRQSDYVPPWEQHKTRYSGTPPTTATMSPPPVPWDNQETPRQRRQSHSPRQSYEGRRSSRSPATSINGQPRRLRFEDLASGDSHNGGYSSVGQHDSYDAYDHARWSQGVGEAL